MPAAQRSQAASWASKRLALRPCRTISSLALGERLIKNRQISDHQPEQADAQPCFENQQESRYRIPRCTGGHSQERGNAEKQVEGDTALMANLQPGRPMQHRE